MTREEVFEGLKEVLSVIRPHTDLSQTNFQTELVRVSATPSSPPVASNLLIVSIL